MAKAGNERDSLNIALSNTPFPSGTCFDNTEYDNHRSVSPSGVIDPSPHDNINRTSPSSVIELSPQENNNRKKTTDHSVDTAIPTIVVKNSKTLTSEEQLIQYRGKKHNLFTNRQRQSADVRRSLQQQQLLRGFSKVENQKTRSREFRRVHPPATE